MRLLDCQCRVRSYERADYFSRSLDQPLAPSESAVAIIDSYLELSER